MKFVNDFSAPSDFLGFVPNVGVELTATILDDENGNSPSSGETVTFEILPQVLGATLSATSGDTDADGKAKTTLTCSSAVSRDVTVIAKTAEDTTGKSVTVMPRPAVTDQIDISVSPDQLPNGDNYYLAQVGTVVRARVSNTDTGELVDDNTKVSWTVDPALPDDSYLLFPAESFTKNGTAETTLKLIKELPSNITKFTVTAQCDTASDATASINIAQTRLAAPIVLNADSGDGFILDETDIDSGVTAIIPGPVLSGEIYTLYWSDNNGAAPVEISVLAESSDSLAFNLDRYAAKAFTDGRHGIFYTVGEISGNIEYSKSIAVTVIGGSYTPETLPQPSIPAAESNNDSIGTGNSQGDVQVIVRYPGITEKDHVSLFWNAYTSDMEPLKIASVTLEKNPTAGASQTAFYIPHDFLYPFPGGVGVQNGFVKCYYITEAADGTTARSHTYLIRLDTVDG